MTCITDHMIITNHSCLRLARIEFDLRRDINSSSITFTPSLKSSLSHYNNDRDIIIAN